MDLDRPDILSVEAIGGIAEQINRHTHGDVAAQGCVEGQESELGYLPIVLSVEESVLKMEQRALDTFLDRAEITSIFSLRRELMKFQRPLGPMGEVASRLEHMDSPCLDAEVRPYFRDVLDHVRHVESMVEGLRDVLGSVFEVSALLEQQRQGTTTRMLAAWAAILAVPTAIAGIYGMNFENILN